MSLEQLVLTHIEKKEKVRRYFQQFTYSLALLCFIFFGTIVSYHATELSVNRITGMAVTVGNSAISNSISNEWSDFTGFVTAVKTSPQVIEIKLFFYTLWVLVVLVGTAILYEFQEKI